MQVGVMNVISLYRDNQHVSATHVAIFRVVSVRTEIYIYIYIYIYSVAGTINSQNQFNCRVVLARRGQVAQSV